MENRELKQNTVFPEYVKEFNKKYPDVKVTITTLQDYDNITRVKMAANDMPDVFEPVNNIDDSSVALPLDDLAIAKDFVAKSTGPWMTNGKTYGLPYGMTTMGIVYNKIIFKSLGLKVPATLDEFIAVAKKIKDSDKVALASAANATPPWTLQYYWQSVPATIAGDPDVANKAALIDEPFTDNNPIVKSYEILKRFTDEKILEKDPLSKDWEGAKADFRAGNTGMFFLGNWFVPQATGAALKESDIGFFPFPYDNNKGLKNVIVQPDHAWALSKNSKSPAAAKAFFNFLMTEKYADFAAQNGMLSARKSIKVCLPYVAEFNSYKPNYLVDPGQTQALRDIFSKMQFDNAWTFGQSIIAGKDVKKAFSELNAQWKAARASLNTK